MTVMMARDTKATSRIARLARHPLVCVMGLLLGGVLGHIRPDWGLELEAPGQFFLTLMKLSVYPIIPAAVIGSLSRLLRSGQSAPVLRRMVVVFTLAVLLGSALGIASGLCLRPGANLNPQSEAYLGQVLLQGEIKAPPSGMWQLLLVLVPANVFETFSTGQIIGMIVVSILMGIALGLNQRPSATYFLHVIEAVHDTFGMILHWVLYGLAPGIFCLAAGQMAKMGTEALLALGSFAAHAGIGMLVLSLICLMAISFSTGRGIGEVISALKEPLLIAFSAGSCIAPMPLAIERLEEGLGQPRWAAQLMVPLGISMSRQTYPFVFSFTAVFLAQFYGHDLSMGQVVNLWLLAGLAGMVSVGRMPVVVPMLAYVLEPCGIPVSAGAALFTALGPLLDPLIQTATLIGACAMAVMVGGRRKMPVDVAVLVPASAGEAAS